MVHIFNVVFHLFHGQFQIIRHFVYIRLPHLLMGQNGTCFFYLFLEISRSVRHPVLAAYIVNHGTPYPHERKCLKPGAPVRVIPFQTFNQRQHPLVYKLFLLQKGSGHGPQLHCRGTHNGKIVHNQPVSQFLAAVFSVLLQNPNHILTVCLFHQHILLPLAKGNISQCLYLYIVVNLTEGYHRYVGVKLVNELFKVNPHHRRGQYNGYIDQILYLIDLSRG